MTKRDLLKKLNFLLAEKEMPKIETMNGKINENCNKGTIQDAIDCLECDEKTLDDYMTVFRLKYPNSYKAISNNGNWKLHPHNRLYVYETAKRILEA